MVDLPQGNKPISVKWIFKAKPGPSGTIDKLKARLVARGFEQTEGIDFFETFAHVVRWSTVRSIVTLAAQKNWKIHHLDVKTAFLNGTIDEEVYMTLPPGFETDLQYPGQVCKLQQALYGLRQAPRAWYGEIDVCLQSQGLTKSKEEPNLYFSICNGKYTILLLYVDDILITGDDTSNIDILNAQLNSKYKMTYLGDAQLYLGVKLLYTPDGIYFHQRSYIQRLLERFGM
jgi:hypothetical protein